MNSSLVNHRYRHIDQSTSRGPSFCRSSLQADFTVGEPVCTLHTAVEDCNTMTSQVSSFRGMTATNVKMSSHINPFIKYSSGRPTLRCGKCCENVQYCYPPNASCTRSLFPYHCTFPPCLTHTTSFDSFNLSHHLFNSVTA